ncbi:hypothetical protein LZ30DRAFT_303782 [Colletotrichum cereale]|nr:hypothetical protein LZ30DRAFT_303782 [Colletotrichum cereale]
MQEARLTFGGGGWRLKGGGRGRERGGRRTAIYALSWAPMPPTTTTIRRNLSSGLRLHCIADRNLFAKPHRGTHTYTRVGTGGGGAGGLQETQLVMSDIARMRSNSSRQQSREASRRTQRTSSPLCTRPPAHPATLSSVVAYLLHLHLHNRRGDPLACHVLVHPEQIRPCTTTTTTFPPPSSFTPLFLLPSLPLCLGPGFTRSEN